MTTFKGEDWVEVVMDGRIGAVPFPFPKGAILKVISLNQIGDVRVEEDEERWWSQRRFKRYQPPSVDWTSNELWDVAL